jgi:hypothetical protein
MGAADPAALHAWHTACSTGDLSLPQEVGEPPGHIPALSLDAPK